jgi:hypothetical protein
MRVLSRSASVVATAALLGGCASAMPKPMVTGRNVEVTRRDAKDRTTGELVAVDAARLWVRGAERVEAVPLGTIDRVQLRRHGMTGKRAWGWTFLGALLTGSALTLACAEVSDGCGPVFVTVAATWLLIGGPSSAALDRSSKLVVRGPDWRPLEPYARFPQGIPAGLDVTSLLQRPTEPQEAPRR